MKRFLSTCILVLAALFSMSCTDNNGSVSEIQLGSGIAIVPRFVYLGAQTSIAAISQVRLTARNVVTNAVVATTTIPVSNDPNWTLSLDVPTDAGTITVLIELLSGSPGTETIEWSGETAEIHITPGTAVAPQTVTLFQGPPGNLDVASVNVTPATQTVVEGTTVALTGAIVGGGAGAKIIWSTLDPTIATVDQNGNVTTLRNGAARITGVAGPRSDTTFLTVTQRPNTITLSPDTGRINTLGADAVFTARVLDPRGAEIAGAGINWTAANGAVVDNLGNGRFRARANGSTQVTATSATAPAVTRNGMVVVAQRAGRVQITPPTATVNAFGSTQQFAAAVQDGNGNTMTTPVVWRSGNAAIATIDGAGLATARSNGTADIVAVINAGAPDSVVAHASLIVNQALSAIVVTPGNANFASFGETANFGAEARDANANVITGVTFLWSSSNGAVVTIDQNGLARATGNGNAQVFATAGGVSGSANVAVHQVATTVVVAPGLDSVAIGGNKTFTATARDARNNLIANPTFAWSSSDASKATVNGTGVATGVAAGSATIRATLDGASGNGTLVVVQRARALQITPPAATLNALGTTQQFTAAIQDGNGTTMTAPVVWRSGSPAVATIDANGLATARGSGVTDIVAVVNAGAPDSVVAHASLTVNQGVGTVIVTPGNAGFGSLGETARLTAEARDANNNPVPGVIFGWTSANPAVATVDPDGTVHAVANGTTQVTATGGGGSGSATITVRQLATAIIVTPAADTAFVNGTRTFNASARDARADPINDASFTWQSSNPAVATVNSTGTARGVSGGTASITAMADGASGMATFVVRNPSLPNLRAFAPVVTPADTVVENSNVQVAIKVKNTGAGASTATNLRLGVALADAPTVLVFSEAALPAIAAGDSVVALLTIHLTNIVGFPDSVRVSLQADAGATVTETDETDNTRFSSVVQVKFLDRQWTGNTSTNWSEPTNWSPAGPPRRTSIATIPNGLPRTPVLTSNVEIAGLIQQTANTIDIEGFNLTVNGSISGAVLHGGGTVYMTRTGTVNGTLRHLVVSAPVTLDGMTTANNVSVESGGQLILNGQHFLATGSFATTGNGILVMMNAADNLEINGSADFSGGSTVGKLTMGRITVRGATFHAGGIAKSFSPAAAHETFFSGAAPQAISLDEPGTGNNFHHFGTLYIANNNGVTVNSDIAVLGNIEFGAAGGALTGAFHTATLLGGIEDDISDGNFYQIENTIFGGTEVELPHNLHTNATFKKQQTLETETTYNIYGSLTLDGGTLILNGSSVHLDGLTSYDFLTKNGGRLSMINSTDRLYVGGNVTFSGGNETNRLTGGEITVGRDFAATGAANSFVAAPSHVTIMNGYDFESRPETHISMSAPAVNGQHFGKLRILNPVTMTTDIAISGDIELTGGYEILGVDLTATIQGRIYDQYYEGESPARLDPRSTAAKAARTAARGLRPSRRAGAKPNSAAQLSWDGGYYHITNTILAGTLQDLPSYIETNITVVSAVTFTRSNTEIDGNLTVTGAAGNLKLLGYIPELEQYLGPFIEVEGDFRTQSGGVLTMNDNCECSTELRVYGNASFNGGNTTGKLIGGILDVGGDFTAGGEGGGNNAFVATGNFVTRIDNPWEASGYATIAMGNPNNTTGNRFHNLIIDRPTQLATDIATHDIDISNGYSLTGVDMTAYVSGDIYTPSEGCECDGPARMPRTMRKAPTASLKAAPAHRAGSAPNSAAAMWEDPYMVTNTVLNGTGTQALPSYLTTNLTVVSDIEIRNSDYYYSDNEINGNVTVTGSGAVMRLVDQFTVDGAFYNLNGGILSLNDDSCDCNPSMVFNGNATFDGGSELGQLEAGQITMTGVNGNTLTAGANAHAFATTGTQVNLVGAHDFALNFAHPSTQTIRDLGLAVLGTISIPNGLVVTGSLTENSDPYFVPTFQSAFNQQLVVGGDLWLNGAAFNNVTLNIDGGHPSAMTNLSFGDYDAGADRIRFTSVPVDFNSLSVDSPVFDNAGTGDFIRNLATNFDVYVYDPTPAATARRHATGTNSHIYWGSGEFPSTAGRPVATKAPKIELPKR